MVPDIAAKGHSFKGAFAYYLHDKRQAGEMVRLSAERVAWTETRNLITDDPAHAKRIMIATAQRADELKAAAGVKNTGRRSNAHVYAYSLAWHPDEAGQLTRGDMVAAADESLKVLAAERLQAVIVCHADQKHPHVHIILNRVDPETGRLHTFSNDRLKLSGWANEYERGRGQILTPRREEKRLAREAFNKAGASGPDDSRAAGSQKPVQREKLKTEASILKELSDAQKARHKAEWPALSQWNQDARAGIYSDFGRRIAEAGAAHKAANRALWAQHFRQARREQRAFDHREHQFAGVIRNALDAATHQQAGGQIPGRGKLSLTFQNMLDAQARARAFAEKQNMSRAQLARSLKVGLDAEIRTLKEQRAAALSAQRMAFQQERTQLIGRQNAERTKMREAWRQVYERRGKDPRYQGRQNAAPSSEQKPMKKDFEKAQQVQQPAKPHPAERRFVSNPAPAPSPAGGPPKTQRTVQNVPKKDWGAKAPDPASKPQLKKDWDAKDAPQKAREIKPLPARNQSQDRTRNR